ncbi:hypothetical protein AB0V79_29280 [Mesorhizobium ciceri]|uniref:hypothetical protein n=1 Tax=Mesorhizobium TaxID=68287 RepID=UPI000A58F11F|nr:MULTISPECIES: hypothetical protein [Mesorhizobium]RUY85179.1 hypothetical protein EN974_35170 [Mesorhizobium sp. M7A.F.Ca.CA.001.12.2.1]RUZ21668.1 hypothetical protein EN949_21170 [Mesorhizobium sp. M7A.F.Ca.US.007.01.2.1]RUZ41134.1 hypothetical protein EN948_29415 [Mesorhizobium sp. M7A.F.Ca.US.003.02.1.1]RVA53619.1 hypothetical protein EN933_12305 [Mesorhizobium sp. M7A.F.Ca.US.001.01.1.1]
MVAVSALAKRIPAEMTKLLPAAGSVMDDLNEAFRVGSHSNTRAAMCQAVSCPSALAACHSSCEISPLPVRPSKASRFNNGDHIAMERPGVSQVGIGVSR